MAQTGILDYQRYLNTLQTLTNLGQTFPSSQQTYNFTVAGGGTASWPATISWETLILDQVAFSSQATGYVPNLSNSQVVGYFQGSTATQYSSGVISIPANMYSGPILPGGNYNVPLTVVHLEWFDGTTTYAQQIGFIQNWEPGVEIGDPINDFDFFPLYSIPSTLTLTGEAGIVYGDNLTLVATTDMAIDLGVNKTRVRFYRVSTGTDVTLGDAYFTGTVATLVLPTDPNLPIGTYSIYAVSQPRGIYRSATSNTLNVLVESGVPLIVTTSTFTPNKAYYFPDDIVRYDLGVVQDPAFTATGVAIASPIVIKAINTFDPYNETTILTSNFVNGQTNVDFTIDVSMIDIARQFPETTWSITTSTQNTTTYTATLFVYNSESIVSNWGYQTAGRYRAGSTSTSINVGTSTTVTVEGDEFPLTITQSSTSTYFDQTFSITVTNNAVDYYADISIIAVNGETVVTLASENHSGLGTFTVNDIAITTTGTWTIYASYPGDLGSSLVNANLPSVSNIIEHQVITGNDLNVLVTLDRTASNDIVKVSTRIPITLVNTVTFLYQDLELDDKNWERMILTTTETTSSVKSGVAEEAGGGMERLYDSYRSVNSLLGNYNGWTNSGTVYDIYSPQGIQNFNRLWKFDNTRGPLTIPWYAKLDSAVVVRSSDGVPFRYRPNFEVSTFAYTVRFSRNISLFADDIVIIGAEYNNVQKYSQNAKKISPYRLFKYYNGSNYNLNLVTATNFNEILDPITTGTTWTVDFVGTITDRTYTFNMPSVIHAPVNAAPPGTPAGAGNKSRLYEYVQDGPVQVNLYDIYKTDVIGTEDGYNVIALDSEFYGNRTTSMTEENPTRLYFRVYPYTSAVTGTRYNASYPIDQTTRLTPITVTVTKVRYIDLVEYIGEVEIEKPIENAEQKAGTQPPSTITVKLFKFTPTIPQTNTEFKHNIGGGSEELNLPDPITTSTYADGSLIPNGGFRIVEFSTSLNRSQDIVRPTELLPAASIPLAPAGAALPQASNGQYYTTFAWIDNWQNPVTGAVNTNTYKLNGLPAVGLGTSTVPISSIEHQRYNDYGQKYWASTNPGDPVADNLAEFYNEWAMTFGFGQKSKVIASKYGVNKSLIFFDPDFVSTTTYSFPTDTQYAISIFPAETIPPDGDIPANLHATWPGTLELDLEYGRFNPFDVYATADENRPTVDYLVVGGGGAGGSRAAHSGGGGGGGAMVTGTTEIIYGEQIEIIIGNGGESVGLTYTYSTAQAQTPSIETSISSGAKAGYPSYFGSIVAVGGGYGGSNGYGDTSGGNGGSGGGSSGGSPGNGINGQGFAGGNHAVLYNNVIGGGGGGAGAVGGNASSYEPPPPYLQPPSASGGLGGAGKIWFDGNYYAGGGGGAVNYSGAPSSAGGIGGGGAGGNTANVAGVAGTANTGGGGGGSIAGSNGSAGGSGIVILRTLASIPIAYTTNCVISTVGDYRFYKWTTNGSIIF